VDVASVTRTRSAHGAIDPAGLTEVEEHWPGIVQQRVDAQRAIGGDQVEIGHPTADQGVAVADVVVNVQAGHHRRESPAGLVHLEQLRHDLAQGSGAFVLAAKRD
jgi:hypothetical protein